MAKGKILLILLNFPDSDIIVSSITWMLQKVKKKCFIVPYGMVSTLTRVLCMCFNTALLDSIQCIILCRSGVHGSGCISVIRRSGFLCGTKPFWLPEKITFPAENTGLALQRQELKKELFIFLFRFDFILFHQEHVTLFCPAVCTSAN